MHTTVPEAVTLAGRIEDGLADLLQGGRDLPEVVICPPFTSLSAVADIFDERILHVGAQDCHWADHGPHTGEVAASMLQGLAEYVILGHPDRRRVGERDETIARKLTAAVKHGLVPIVCVGEEDANDLAAERSAEMLQAALADVEVSQVRQLLVAYEPAWAVNSGQAADTNQVAEVTAHLHGTLQEAGISDGAVLYGGSVSPENTKQFRRIDTLDGLVLGAAALQAESLLQIVSQVTE